MKVAVFLLVLPACTLAVLTDITKCFTTTQDGIKVAIGRCDDYFVDGVCEKLFKPPKNNGVTNAQVDQACYTVPAVGSWCSKRCLLCCEDPKYNCSNVASEAACAALQESGGCENAALKELMIEKCPNTCGFCDLQGKPLPNYCPNKDANCEQLVTNLGCEIDFSIHQCGTTCKLPCPATTSTATTTAYQCDADWEYFAGSCYKNAQRSVNRAVAEQLCRSLSSTFVTIESTETREFVVGMAKGPGLWVGLEYIGGQWKWNDGTIEQTAPQLLSNCDPSKCVFAFMSTTLPGYYASDGNGGADAICVKPKL